MEDILDLLHDASEKDETYMMKNCKRIFVFESAYLREETQKKFYTRYLAMLEKRVLMDFFNNVESFKRIEDLEKLKKEAHKIYMQISSSQIIPATEEQKEFLQAILEQPTKESLHSFN